MPNSSTQPQDLPQPHLQRLLSRTLALTTQPRLNLSHGNLVGRFFGPHRYLEPRVGARQRVLGKAGRAERFQAEYGGFVQRPCVYLDRVLHPVDIAERHGTGANGAHQEIIANKRRTSEILCGARNCYKKGPIQQGLRALKSLEIQAPKVVF